MSKGDSMTDRDLKRAMAAAASAFLLELNQPEGDEGAEGAQRVMWRIALLSGNSLIESSYFSGERFASRAEADRALGEASDHLDAYPPYQVEMVCEDV